MRADRAGHHRVHDPLGNFDAIGQQDRRIGHQVADIADEQQAAARQRSGSPRGPARSGSSVRVSVLPPLSKLSARSPRITPSQLR